MTILRVVEERATKGIGTMARGGKERERGTARGKEENRGAGVPLHRGLESPAYQPHLTPPNFLNCVLCRMYIACLLPQLGLFL